MEESKLLLGKLLGETYRVQKALKMPRSATAATIYGLLNGFEDVVDEEIKMIGLVTKAQLDHTIAVLDEYFQDEDKLKALKGFYDIERRLEQGGVDRSTAIRIFTYLQANGQFQEVIAKMDSSNSPTECRTFDIPDFEK